jgi:hypothetical protein
MAYFDPRPFVILMCGTSLTTGRLSCNISHKLEMRLNAVCKRRVRVISAGKGSQTSEWGVTQIPWWCNFNADAATIEFAINDAAPALFTGGIPQHRTNMFAIIDGLRARNPAIDLTVQTMSPVGIDGASQRPDLAGLYQSDRDIAAEKSCRILDHNAAWLQAIPGQPTSQYAFPHDGTWTQGNDGLHPLDARVDTIPLPALVSHFRPIIDATVISQ